MPLEEVSPSKAASGQAPGAGSVEEVMLKGQLGTSEWIYITRTTGKPWLGDAEFRGEAYFFGTKC